MAAGRTRGGEAASVRQQLATSAGVLAGQCAGGPVHDFDVVVAATVTDPDARRGVGLKVVYGFHESPFGAALVMLTNGALCGLAFADDDSGKRAALADMTGRWPRARYGEAAELTGPMADRIFGSPASRRVEVPVALIGTPFDLGVWQALLRIPMGRLVTYTDIARHLGRPEAARAVGTANGRNPISFVVPCHRALRGDGALGGYYWGLARKQGMIAWEAARTSSAPQARRLSASARR